MHILKAEQVGVELRVCSIVALKILSNVYFITLRYITLHYIALPFLYLGCNKLYYYVPSPLTVYFPIAHSVRYQHLLHT